MKIILSGLLMIVILFVSCSKSHNNYSPASCNSTYDPCAIQAPAAEVDSVVAYLASKGITDAVKHCSGMYYKIDTVGTGNTANICSTVTVKYIGQFTNGNIFDQESDTAVAFSVKQLIAGFKNGISLIKEGGVIHLYVPPSLGFGSQQNGVIPPNSMLIFRVSLIGVQ